MSLERGQSEGRGVGRSEIRRANADALLTQVESGEILVKVKILF